MPSDSRLQICHRCADNTKATSHAHAPEVCESSFTCLHDADGVAHACARTLCFWMGVVYSEHGLRWQVARRPWLA